MCRFYSHAETKISLAQQNKSENQIKLRTAYLKHKIRMPNTFDIVHLQHLQILSKQFHRNITLELRRVESDCCGQEIRMLEGE